MVILSAVRPWPTKAIPFAKPFHHEGWIYEEKVDGYRMVVYKDGDLVKLVSRQGRDHTTTLLLSGSLTNALGRAAAEQLW